MIILVSAIAAIAVVAGIGIGTLIAQNSAPSDAAPTANAPSASATSDTQASETAVTDVTETFLDALVQGDAAAALAVLSSAPSGSSAPLLAEDVYAAATHPSEYEITGISVEQQQATVRATLVIDGVSHPTEFTLAPDSAAGQGWSITSAPLVSIAAEDVGDVSAVNGVAVDLSAVTPGTSLVALPGGYRFAAPPDRGYLTFGGDVTVIAAPGSAAAIAFTPTLSSAGKQAAVAEVQARIATCMESDAFRPRDCPNVLEMIDPVTRAITSISRSWINAPTATLVDNSTSTSASYAVVITGGDVRISYEWRYAEGEPWTADDETHTAVFGSASGGTVVPVTVDSSGSLSFDYDAF